MNALRNLHCVSASRITTAHVPGVRFRSVSKRKDQKFHVPTGHAAFIYGTAWKRDQTKEMVKEAFAAGFRRLDTAAQPKHYREDLVGEGLREAISEGTVKRKYIYIQTKFTPPAGQDLDNMPYDPTARMSDQINQSVSKSLRILRPETKYISREVYLDALLLHSPMPTIEETLEVWSHLEAFARTGRAKQLGLSNVDLPTLKAIWDNAKTKPTIVQNRFHAETGYDVQLRAFCEMAHITYQAFWTLTGNPELLGAQPVVELAQSAGIARPVALYALVMDLDILVLNGTTSAEHMREDLNGMQIVGKWASENKGAWEGIRQAFRVTIGDKPLSHRDPRFRGLVLRKRGRAILMEPDAKTDKNMSS